MKRIIEILLLSCACLTSVTLHAQDASALKGTSCVPVMTTDEDSLAFHAGERMEFILHYKWGSINTDVGSATVSLDSLTFNGHESFCCSVYGKTTRLFDLFFRVREDFRSWFTRDGLRPLKFTRDTHEGGYEARNTYLYDWDAPEPHIDAEIYTSKRGQQSVELPLTPCTYDLPSLFFFARNMDIENVEYGKKYPMTFAIDDEVFNVYFIMYGRESIKVKGLGTVNAIKFAAKLLEGEVFQGEEDMMIWISDDGNRLPVYFEAPLRVGVAAGRLVGYKGLKYPFSSLVKTKKR